MRCVSDLARIPASAFPRDSDGFMSRECPECEGRFKVEVDDEAGGSDLSDEEALAAAEAMQRYCPLCHAVVDGNKWWTPEQIEYAASAVSAVVQSKFQDMLEDTARQSRGILEFRRGAVPAVPAPPEETDGMLMVVPPCHEDDRLKVPDDWTAEVACHRCGVRYPIDLIEAAPS
jgi:hypothetical protein